MGRAFLRNDLDIKVGQDPGYLSNLAGIPIPRSSLPDKEKQAIVDDVLEWVRNNDSPVNDLDEPILVNEQLFRDAIQVNRICYNEAQVYPYYCECEKYNQQTLTHSTSMSKSDFLN